MELPQLPYEQWNRTTVDAINEAFRRLEVLTNFTAAAPLNLTSDSAAVQLALDTDTLAGLLPAGTDFRVYGDGTLYPLEGGVNLISGSGVTISAADNPGASRTDVTISAGASAFRILTNGGLLPAEPRLNLIAGANVTISGVDNAGATRSDVTVNALPDGGTFIFNSTVTFGGPVTFSSTVVYSSTVTFNGPIVVNDYLTLNAAIIQTPAVLEDPDDPLDPGEAQWVELTTTSPTTYSGIAAPPAGSTGRFLEITNTGGNTVTFTAGGGGADGVITPDTADYRLYSGNTVFLKYDAAATDAGSWRVLEDYPQYRVNSGAGVSAYHQRINFIAGSGITLAGASSTPNGEYQLTISAAADTDYYQTVQRSGVSQTQRGKLNFIPGSNVTITVSDNSGNDSTDVTIAANSTGGTTSTNGQGTGAGSFSLSTSFANWTVGPTVSLPSAGTYLVIGTTRVRLNISAGAPGQCQCLLWDATNGQPVSGIQQVASATVTGQDFDISFTLHGIYTLSGTAPADIYFRARVNGATFTTAELLEDAGSTFGATSGATIDYVKLN